MASSRLDELLVQRGLFPNAHDAQAAIMAGEVVVGEHRADSAGMRVKDDVAVRLKDPKRTGGYVSRGGLKLQRALEVFAVDPVGLSCVDLGTSSGGFTDCLLQHGAAHVSAVDVSTEQFDWKLRNDERVSLFEASLRGLDFAAVEGPFDLAVADLSFIGLDLVMGDIAGLLKPDGRLISLIKPQFEAAREDIQEGGVVYDPAVHVACIQSVLQSALDHGFVVIGLTHSPVKGPAGNIEFLFNAEYRAPRADEEGSMSVSEIEGVVMTAHRALRGDS